MTKYELSLTKNYVPDWTVVDAVRELFQNALDQQTVRKDNPMFWLYANGTLKIGNAKSVLEPKSLLLGASTKADDDNTIGKFGEGYKIATLVLTRLGKAVTFYNYGAREVWTARFSKSRKYGAEILVFDVDKKFPWTSIPHNDLTIAIEGVTEEEMALIIESNLHMQDEYESLTTNHGEVLTEERHKGKMFVNGLYISTDDSFGYGYNFHPSKVDLDRDRRLIPDFNLKWTTSQMWLSSQDEEVVSRAHKLVKADAPDTQYITSVAYTGDIRGVSEKVTEDFVNEYGNSAVPVTTQKEAELVPKTHRPIIVTENVASMVKSSERYVAPEPVYVPTFVDKVSDWLDKHGGNIKRDARRELIKLIEEEQKTDTSTNDGIPF